MGLKTHFTVTEDHLKLIRRMYIGYNEGCEFGAPEVNPKRPYGNSSVYQDIGEILEIEPNSDGEFTDAEYDRFLTLHKETATALQIALRTGQFKTGDYVCEQYTENWSAVEGDLTKPKN